MPGDKPRNQEPDILDHLFGDPAELADDELALMYEALARGTDPAATIGRLAEAAAIQYRTLGKVPPDHIQAALNATRVATSLEDASPSKLRGIVDAIKTPFTGAVSDPAFAYRNRDGQLEDDDQAIVDDLTEELQQDWHKDDEDH